jgi:Ca-activated chloride channel homolog
MGRRPRHPLASVLAASLLLPATAVAADIPRFSASSELVVLSAIAVDKKGRPVTDLKREEFRVFEDGRPQPLQHFSRGPGLPARMLLLVDASGSMNSELKEASLRMAIIQLLAALSPEDQVALAGFDSRYFGLVQFTRDRSKIQNALGELKPWGTTALHDALDKAAHDLASHGEGRRAVVVITDGVDNASSSQPDDVIARSRALDVPIYTLSVVSPLDDPGSNRFSGEAAPADATKGAQVLARYADMSGGAAFIVSDFTKLKMAADRIVAELRHQYRLGYVPPAGPASFRKVEIRATRKGVTVKTRSGYVPASPAVSLGEPR